MLPLLCLFCFVIFLVGLILWLSTHKYWKFPGYGLPIIGNLYYCIRNIPRTLHAAIEIMEETHEKYGDTVAIHIGPFVTLSTKDPILMKEILFHPQMQDKEPMYYRLFHAVFKGAFSRIEPDAYWKESRKAVASQMGMKQLECFHGVFQRRSRELIKKFATMEGEFDLQHRIFLMAADITAETFVGVHYDFLNNEQFEISREFYSLMDEFCKTLVYGGLYKVSDRTLRKRKHLYSINLQIAKDVIKNYNDPKSDKDNLSMMSRLLEEEIRKGVPAEKMLKPIAELSMEGTFAISLVVTSALLYIAANPEIQRKAWEEQDRVLGNSIESPNLKDLSRMEFLGRIVKETLRLVTPSAIARRSTGCIKTSGMVIPKNTTVIFFWGGLRKDRKYWKNGIQFDPDHFLPEEVEKRHKCANLSFSLGPRGCPGYHFSINCVKVILSDIIRTFKISSSHKPKDMKYRHFIFTHLDIPWTISLEPRAGMDRMFK